MTWAKFWWLIFFSLMVGCSHQSIGKIGLPQNSDVPAKEYRIQPGDQLDIKLFYNPELNEQLTVRPDGRITLQLVNDVVAAGLTPAELTNVLTKAYSSELRNPKVAVILRTSVADRVYVDGEVNRAGLIPLVGPTTVLQSISQAGGVKETAKSGEVILLRKTEDNKVAAYKINLEDALDGGGGAKDIYLKPNDIIYVPKSTISNINTWVDLYIRKNIPIPLGLSIGTL
ncbi:polysaccharide secretin protein HfsD [Geomonas limicola]|uniref:Polysaccharide secretin protein HfsD n=1 Tax=Geomonas limicola TaxID=2740186 RepID=A0A6V8NEV3_9BACT|nr:polysaccharide biosynthesis/export family protein [Geomonas limicola]GFO69649.1 polysaccharide secretin protein HfsD [Geomonas limicola]